MAAADLQAGDLILVKPGERIAADGEIETGKTSIDESALTGESIPAEKHSETRFCGYGQFERIAHGPCHKGK